MFELRTYTSLGRCHHTRSNLKELGNHPGLFKHSCPCASPWCGKEVTLRSLPRIFEEMAWNQRNAAHITPVDPRIFRFFREGDISRGKNLLWHWLQKPRHYHESATLSPARDHATLVSCAPGPNTEAKRLQKPITSITNNPSYWLVNWGFNYSKTCEPGITGRK